MSADIAGHTIWVTHPWVAEGQGRIRFGAGVSGRAPLPEWSTRLELAQTLEALGFDSHWTPDHPAMSHDCWTTLSALAVATSRIRLGPLVSCVLYRSPVQLARLAADVDRLSGGRLILGLGCGWIEPEFRWLGLAYPPVAVRQQMLVETIAILHGLWGTAVGSDAAADTSHIGTMLNLPGPPPLVHQGAHYRLDEALLRPGPVQRPRIPIMIAGGGERVTLRQVARYADAANLGMDGTPGATRTLDDAQRKLATLDQHCADHGRTRESVVPTHFVNPVMLAETAAALVAKRAALPPSYRNAQGIFGTPEDAIAFYRPYVEAGMRYFIVNLTTFDDLETPRLLAERVFPALQN